VKTVKELREELAKFPDDAVCWAYEGEDTGIAVAYSEELWMYTGFIFCSWGAGYDNQPTKPLPDRAAVEAEEAYIHEVKRARESKA
jgi:hypothetical protein